MYDLLGLCLTLAILLTINTLATLALTALWRVLKPLAEHWSAAKRARTLFLLRVTPFIIACAFAGGLVVPSYLLFEPHETAENVSIKLAVFALISFAGLLLAVWRGLAAWLTTRRLVANWLRHSEPVRLSNVAIPVHRVRHTFPLIAIVGAFRPRLFIAAHLFDELSTEEFSAAIAHESGHLIARDNFKRAFLRACRDMLAIMPCGRALDQEWAESAEIAADEHAAQSGGAAGALDLASALVKIARLVPVGARPAMPIGAYLTGEISGGGNVERRVRRLTQLAMINQATQQTIGAGSSSSHRFIWTCLCGLPLAILLSPLTPHLLTMIHTGIEQIVHLLK